MRLEVIDHYGRSLGVIGARDPLPEPVLPGFRPVQEAAQEASYPSPEQLDTLDIERAENEGMVADA